MKKEYRFESRSDCAARLGVSYGRICEWVRQGRLESWEPAPGVVLVKSGQGKPKARRPWHHARAEREKKSLYEN